MKTMYDYLKILLETSEKIGTVEAAELYPKTTYRGSGVEITGTSDEGMPFVFRIEAKKDE